MSDLTNYVVELNGTETVVQLSDEDAKRYKDGDVELKEYKAPANKAAGAPAAKAAGAPAAKEAGAPAAKAATK